VLHAATEIERAGASARSPRRYVRETFARLHTEAERAIVENLASRGWEIRSEPAAEAHGFWATILGVVLERSAQDEAISRRSAEAAVALVLNLYTEPDREARDADA
jgi:TetR/AcrR family transcriptional regulator, regulator of cefoperazone and chloramphenicol sensitivity